MPTNRTQPDPLILCVSCRYDLTGLNERGVCPECSSPVAQSVAASHHPVAPPWLRLLAIAYFTSVAVFTVGMLTWYIVPWSATNRGLNFAALADRAAVGLLITWLLGWIVILAIEDKSRWLGITIGVTQCLVIVAALLQPASGIAR
ncbi:MAG: hypothetical protein K2W85_13180 [Phycisphaerales bacterium]|nr:hypothetical protein [Phycisphaerales bacterium]